MSTQLGVTEIPGRQRGTTGDGREGSLPRGKQDIGAMKWEREKW